MLESLAQQPPGGTWQPGGWAEFVLTPDMLLYETTVLRVTGP